MVSNPGLPHYKMPSSIHETCTPLEIAVYGAFKRRANLKTGETFVSVATIAQGPGLSRKSVEKALRSLTRQGYISSEWRGKMKTAIRRLSDTPKFDHSDTPKSGVEKERQLKREDEHTQPDPEDEDYNGFCAGADRRIYIGLTEQFKPGQRFHAPVYGPSIQLMSRPAS